MRIFSLLALPLLLGAATAQSSFIVPTKAAGQIGNGYNFYTFYYSSTPAQPVHQQFLYNTSDVPVQAGILRGLAFRRPNSIGNANPAATATVAVMLSVGPNDSNSISTTFANNLGTNQVQVFQGNLNLPPAVHSTGVPPALVMLPFSQVFPFVRTMGPGLVVDITTSAYTPVSNASWYIDAVGTVVGQRVTNWSASRCRFSNNNSNNSISHRNPVLGSTWFVNYNSILPNAPGVGAVGIRGAGMAWGPINLPFDLTLLGAPGCAWAVSMELTYPLQASATGSAPGPVLAVPNDPLLSGAAFFDHSLFLDPAANALGAVTGWSSKWIIGSGQLAEGAVIYKSQDTTPPSPTGVKLTTVPVAEFMH